MNFLVFDNEFVSTNLINTILADFHYVTLITSNQTPSTIPSSPSFIVQAGDINNAKEVIDILAKHEDDPFDAILIFNLSLHTSVNNVLQSIERVRRQSPHLFLFSITPSTGLNDTVVKLLKDAPESIPWTAVHSNEIDSSPAKKYRVEIKSDPTTHETISAADLFNFILNELQSKNFSRDIIYLY